MPLPDLFTVMLTAALLGSMLFFAAIVAPAVFHYLPQDAAGTYLRGFFPRYYLWGTAVGGLAAVAAAFERGWVALVLAAIALAFLGVRQGLVPRINAARDASLAGDAGAGVRFSRLHGLSVLINLVQMLLAGGVLGWLIWVA